MKTLHCQKGLSLTELLVSSALIGFAALVVMKLFPLYNESFKVSTSMTSIVNTAGIEKKSAAQIRKLMLRNFEVQDVDQFTRESMKKHLIIEKVKGTKERTMTMTYESRKPFLGDLDVVFKFNKTLPLAGLGSES